jgi:hypothetical protein
VISPKVAGSALSGPLPPQFTAPTPPGSQSPESQHGVFFEQLPVPGPEQQLYGFPLAVHELLLNAQTPLLLNIQLVRGQNLMLAEPFFTQVV